MSLEETDAASRAVQKAGHPRVSLDDIKANIAGEYYMTGANAVRGTTAGATPQPGSSLEVLTICIIETQNGFTVIGKAAPADPENFDPDLGRKFAREDAMRQLWPLMGYALRETLAKAA